MKLTQLFCDVDDFCCERLETWTQALITEGKRKRQRKTKLSMSEIITQQFLTKIFS